MPALEIERIYQSKEEIEEYRKASANLEGLKFAGDCLWDLDVSKVLDRWASIQRQLEAWNSLCGLLDDLTAEERKRFDEAARRGPFFGGDD